MTKLNFNVSGLIEGTTDSDELNDRLNYYLNNALKGKGEVLDLHIQIEDVTESKEYREGKLAYEMGLTTIAENPYEIAPYQTEWHRGFLDANDEANKARSNAPDNSQGDSVIRGTFEDGVNAGVNGNNKSANPFNIDEKPVLHHSWDAGWREGYGRYAKQQAELSNDVFFKPDVEALLKGGRDINDKVLNAPQDYSAIIYDGVPLFVHQNVSVKDALTVFEDEGVKAQDTCTRELYFFDGYYFYRIFQDDKFYIDHNNYEHTCNTLAQMERYITYNVGDRETPAKEFAVTWGDWELGIQSYEYKNEVVGIEHFHLDSNGYDADEIVSIEQLPQGETLMFSNILVLRIK